MIVHNRPHFTLFSSNQIQEATLPEIKCKEFAPPEIRQQSRIAVGLELILTAVVPYQLSLFKSNPVPQVFGDGSWLVRVEPLSAGEPACWPEVLPS